jgi:hypothetical protein
MLATLEGFRHDISNLAGVLNQFRSEAVQVKLLDRFFDMFPGSTSTSTLKAAPETVVVVAPKRRGRPPKVVAEVTVLKRTGRPQKVEVSTDQPQPLKGKKRKRSRMGATGALHALIAKGYFKSRRTIADIVQACESQLGASIKVTNLSGPLGNFVDQTKLMRSKNKDGRFEYWVR